MFWLLHVESGEPVFAAGMDISAARAGWDCSFLPKHFQCCWACVFHTVPLNISNSQTALKEKKKTLIIFWNKSAARMLKKGHVGLILLTLVRFTESASLLSYLHLTVVFLSECA